MSIRLCIIPVAVLLTAVSIPAVRAQEGPPPRPGRGIIVHDPAIPGLSADQSRKIRELRNESASRLAALGQELRNYRKALEDQYRSYQMDTTAVKKLNRQINDVQRRMLEEHTRVEQEMREILNSSQFRWLKERMPGGRIGDGNPGRPRR